MKQANNIFMRGLVNSITSIYTLPAFFLKFIFSSIRNQSKRSKDTLGTGIRSNQTTVRIATFVTISLICTFTFFSLVSMSDSIKTGLSENSKKDIITTSRPNETNSIGNESYLTSFTVDGFLSVSTTLFNIAKGVGEKVLVKTPDFTGQTDVKVNWGEEMDSDFSGMYKLTVTGANILLAVFFLTRVLEEVIKLSNGKRADFIAPLFHLFMIQLSFILVPILTSSFITLFNDMTRIILGDSALFEYQKKVFEAIKIAYKPSDEGWVKNFIKGATETVTTIAFPANGAGNFGVGMVVGVVVLLTQLLTLGFVILISITKIQLIFLYIIMPILTALSLFEFTKDVYKSAITQFIRLLLLPLFYVIAFRIVNEFMINLTTKINLETMFLYLGACGFLFTVNIMSAAMFGDYSAYGQEQSARFINDSAVKAGKVTGQAVMAVGGMAVGAVAGGLAGGASGSASFGGSTTAGTTSGASTMGSSQIDMTGDKNFSSNQGSSSSIPKLEGGQRGSDQAKNESKSTSSDSIPTSSSEASRSKYTDSIEADWSPIPLQKLDFQRNQQTNSQVRDILTNMKK